MKKFILFMLFAWVLNQFLGASAPSSSSSNTVESAASIDLEANQLGRRIPAYFKILTFIPDRWDIFADKFIEHPVAQQIKKNLHSVQPQPTSNMSADSIYNSPFFAQKIRDLYTKFKSEYQVSGVNIPTTLDSNLMFESILKILQNHKADKVEDFINEVDNLVVQCQTVIKNYNERLVRAGGNSELIKHFLNKIFFAHDAYTNAQLIAMRAYLKEHALVDGDAHLFGPSINPNHTLTDSIQKFMQHERFDGTIVLGCGRSLIADVSETPHFFGEDFIRSLNKGKEFIHQCQHCCNNHHQELTIAIYAPYATFGYDGCSHADIAADASTPGFIHALKLHQGAYVKAIVDHSCSLGHHEAALIHALPCGGLFNTYADLTEKREKYGIKPLEERTTHSGRREYVYQKISETELAKQ